MEMTFEFNKRATEKVKFLQKHYNDEDVGELLVRAISLLKVAADIENTNGELIARKKGVGENKIIVK